MRYTIALSCLTWLASAVALAANPATAKPPANPNAPAIELQGHETPAQIQEAYSKAIAELSPGLAKNELTDFQKFEALVQRSGRPGAEKERAACCQALAAVLQTDVAQNAKVWILKQLVNLGRAEVVPIETSLLADKDPLLQETARQALEHNPAPAAAAALRTALEQAHDPAWQAALALSLGARRDAAAVPLLAKLLAQKDPRVLEAALVALGDIGDAAAASTLADALAKVPETLRPTAGEARYKCAERMLATGQTAAALKIYRQHVPQGCLRIAAAGLLRADGDKAVRLMFMILDAPLFPKPGLMGENLGSEPDLQSVALGHIAELTTVGVKALVANLDKLPADSRLAVLGALAARGAKEALPAALAAAKSDDPQLRLAGLLAIGQIGDASAVPLLVEAMSATGDAAGIARESLLRLAGPGVNERLVSILQAEKDANRRSTFIGLLDARGAPQLVALMLPDVASNDVQARRQAMRVLGKLARPPQVPAMLPGLFKAAPGGERDEAEKALMFVCNRVAEPDQQADPILEAYRGAGAADRLVLLPLLGRIGGPQALATLKAALAAGDAETRDAAVRGLCNWPDATVAKDLLDLAQRAGQDVQRVMALRALIRVATFKGGLPDKEKLRLLTQAMDLAQRDQERKLVLDRAGSVRTVQTLRMVVPYLDDPVLSKSAAHAAIELAHNGGLRSREKAEYEAALEKVIAVCKDQGLVEQAKHELHGD